MVPFGGDDLLLVAGVTLAVLVAVIQLDSA